MAEAKITGTYTSNNRTMTITKIDTAGNTVGYYDSQTTVLFSSSDNLYKGYGSDTRVINAASAKLALDINAYGSGVTGHNGALTTVTGGKGADTVTAHGNLTIATGAGKDVIGIGSDTGTITITDYAAGSDAIRFVGKMTNDQNKVVDFAGAVTGSAKTDGSVVLSLDGTEKITVKNAADKKITILDTAGNVINDRPFTRNADLTLTEANSGTVASVNDHIIIDASKKTKATVFTVAGKVSNVPQTLTAGKGNDTVYAGNGLSFTGGKGNDYLVISSDTFASGSSYTVNFTDYTPGTKDGNGDRIVIGAGYGFSTAYYQNGTAYIAASETGAAANTNTITINLGTGAVWNQTKPTDGTKNQVLYVTGTTTNGITISDPDLYVEKKLTQAGDLTVNLGSKLTATGDYAKKHISYELTSKALNVTAPNYSDSTLSFVSGGSGKDTLAGSDSETTTVKYNGNYQSVNAATLYGGKGNDLIISNGAGASMNGEAGNDTLRSGAKDATVRAAVEAANGNFGSAVMEGGAGNDVFLLTGEGGGTIVDYTNTTDKTVKKALGTDKIVIANDKPNAKNAVAQSTLSADADGSNVSKRYLVDNGDGEEIELTAGKYLIETSNGYKYTSTSAGTINNDAEEEAWGTISKSTEITSANIEKYADRIAYDLNLTVGGDGYIDSVAAAASTLTGSRSYWGGYAQFSTANKGILTTELAGGKTATVAGGFYTELGGTYTIKDVAKNTGAKLTVVDQGITYTQDVFTGDISKDSNVTVAANYHGALNPYAEVIDGTKSKKAMRLVGNANTTTLAGGSKADTLIANSSDLVSLNGGAGADVFWVNGNSAYIADYGGKTDGTGKEKDKIYGYIPSRSVYVGSDTKTLFIGNDGNHIEIANGVKYTLNGGINFTYDTTYDKVNNKGVITGTTKETHSMVRSFNVGDTIVAAGKGTTDLYIYGDAENTAAAGNAMYGANGSVDSGVMVVDLSKAGKGVDLNVGSSHVVSIKGGAKADTIYGADNFQSVAFGTTGATGNLKGFSDTTFAGATQVTVTTGKGNDVVYVSSGVNADGTGKVYISDFTAAKAKSGKFASGDILYLDGGYVTDVTVTGANAFSKAESDNTYTTGRAMGYKKQMLGDEVVTFVDQDVVIGGTQLKGMKGKQIYVNGLNTSYGGVDLGYAEEAFATVSNAHELVLSAVTKGAEYKVTDNKDSETYIIDATANTKGAKLYGGNYVKEMVGGKAADTIYAGNMSGVQGDKITYMKGAAGADIFYFNEAEMTVTGGKLDGAYHIEDYETKDKVLLGGDIFIEKSTIKGGDYDTSTTGKKTSPTTVHYSDVTLTVVNTVDGSASSLVFDKVADTTGFKITRQVGEGKNASTFALTYGASDVTVAAADGNVIDLTGAGQDNKLNVNIGATRSKAVTIQGATLGDVPETTSIIGTSSKGAITYIAGKNGATFKGSAKADVYQGGTASDVVVFTAGNNTVLGGGKGGSSITFGSGNEVAIVKASDTFNISSYTAGKDVIVLDTVFAGIADFNGASEVKTAVATGATSGRAAKDYVLSFGTGATLASIGFGTELAAGGKITIKMGSAKNGKLVAGATIFQGGFGTNMSFADADGTTINAQYNPFATAITAEDATKVKKQHYLTVGTNSDTKVTAMTGGAGADTLVASYKVASLTGGKGNDTFVVESSTTVTITDFNTGKDILNLKTADSAFKLVDYDGNYSFSGNDLVVSGVTAGAATVVLKGVVSNGATSAIRYVGSDDQSKNGIVLHDRTKIELAKTASRTDFTGAWFSDTTEFDASANAGAIKFVEGASGKLTTFKSGKGGAEVNLTGASTNVTYTDGGGADKVTLGSGKVTFTYAGGADEFTGATANAGNLSVGLASGWSVTGATSVNTFSGGANTATFNVKKGNTTSTIKISGGNDVAVFQLGTTAAYKDDSSAEKVGGTVQNSDTTIYTWKKDIYVSGAGFNQVVFKTITSSAKSSDGTKNDKGEGTVTYNFDERYADEYSVITAAETLFGASEFDEITPAKAEVDVTSTTESEVDSVIKGVTATFAGVGKQRQDK